VADLAAKAAAIELLILDVDGVLTDGGLLYADTGLETKRFHVRDGLGIKLWQQAGKRAAIISGRKSAAVTHRAAELGIDLVLQGRGDKIPAYREVLAATGLTPSQVCVMGDDLPDLPLILASGLSVTVADAVAEVKAAAAFVTKANGGCGAVREAIEWLLTNAGQWNDIVRKFQIAA
jgi:3-deoxy-D-manno-octulosonate 8-phosphate phosphatase (KDO 8-P phosphatase)